MISSRHQRIADALALDSVRDKLRYQDIVLHYGREQYDTPEGMDKVLAGMEKELNARGVSSVTCRSAQNILIELVSNSLLHGSSKNSAGAELLIVAMQDKDVAIWMFGAGRESQIDRLDRVIRLVGSIAEPPNHQAKLFKKRDDQAWATRNHRRNSPGSGLGMLTIAALSSQKLFFRKMDKGREKEFVLRSVVQAG